jgi:peptidoglycan hydrolase CwlO-like protein
MIKGVTQLTGLRDIKTVFSSKKGVIPRTQNSAYLYLYMLRKEKDRLEKEIYTLDKRIKNIQKRIEEVDAEMDRLQEAEALRRNPIPRKSNKALRKDWKTMPLKY